MYIDFPEVHIPLEAMGQATLPKMVRIAQKYDAQKITDVSSHLRQKLQSLEPVARKLAGKRVAITVGSRGIPHLVELVCGICRQLEQWGAEPFVIPAMGSHGGANGEGQRQVLAEYGITEVSVGVPILSGMETTVYGELEGIPLHCDRNAFSADAVVVFNKVKPHTDFRGDIESGLCKMIAIGLGKHKGASTLHARGFAHFARLLPEIAQRFLDTGKVAFGVGVVQNAYDELCAIEVVPPERLIDVDRELLKVAKQRLATFHFSQLDVLVIDQIGKNISGFGFDPNVVGRANSGLSGFADILDLKRLVICGLTEQTNHNGCGISAADVTTRRCLGNIDWEVVWTNMTTSMMLQGGKIPLYMNNDRDAILLAIRACCGISSDRVRLARIRNTLQLHEIEVSQALYDTLKDREDIVYIDGPYPMAFDRDHFLL